MLGRLQANTRERTVPSEPLDVEVEWSEITGLHDEQWKEGYCLYAYVGPLASDIHYIGHTKYSSIRLRKYGRHKKGVYQLIVEQTGLHKKQLRVLRGDVWLKEGKRRSQKLLLQVETLLIHLLQPCGNTAYIHTRNNSRPGMWVECTGHWRHERNRFRDSEGETEYIVRTRRAIKRQQSRKRSGANMFRRILGALW